jgi:hypothetical protein
LRQRLEECFAFGCSFAIAVVISPILPLVLGSKRRWAVESTGAIVGLVVFLVGSGWFFFWVIPWFTLRVISYRYLLFARGFTLHVAPEIGTSWGPIAAVIGLVVGVIAGLVALLARYRPRLGVAVAVGLVLFFALGVGNQMIFGMATDLVLEWRQNHGRWRSVAHVSSWELASALGATTGSFVGVSTAGFALWRSYKARTVASRRAV